MTERVEVHLLIRVPDGRNYEVGKIIVNPDDLGDGLADALEDAAREIRTEGLTGRR